MIKSHRQLIYFEETMKSSQPDNASASLQFQVLCHKHHISMCFGEYQAKILLSVN